SGHRVELGSEAGDDAVRRDVPLRPWLEGQIDAGACSAATSGSETAATDRTCHALYCGILLDEARDLLQLGFHQLKRRIGISADASENGSSVLLREEPLRNDNVEIDVQADRGQQDRHHRPPMIERPAKGPLVAFAQAVESALERSSQAPRLTFGLAPKKP